jgi:hypothetical protein
LQENKETIPSGTASYDEEEPVDTDEDKEEETTEGAENLLAGPSGYEGVPEIKLIDTVDLEGGPGTSFCSL